MCIASSFRTLTSLRTNSWKTPSNWDLKNVKLCHWTSGIELGQNAWPAKRDRLRFYIHTVEMNPSRLWLWLSQCPKYGFLYLYNLRDSAGMEIIATIPSVSRQWWIQWIAPARHACDNILQNSMGGKDLWWKQWHLFLLISSLSFDTQSWKRKETMSEQYLQWSLIQIILYIIYIYKLYKSHNWEFIAPIATTMKSGCTGLNFESWHMADPLKDYQSA